MPLPVAILMYWLRISEASLELILPSPFTSPSAYAAEAFNAEAPQRQAAVHTAERINFVILLCIGNFLLRKCESELIKNNMPIA